MTQTVRHTGYGIVLNLSLDDLGHPDRPGLWEEIYRQRVFQPGLLMCTYRRMGVTCPESMYVQVRDGLRVAVHQNNPDVVPHRSGKGAAHEALQERIAITAERAGHAVSVEDVAADGARITDVLVSGASGQRIGWEVQLSRITPGDVLERSNLAFRDGITPLWAVDSHNAAPINRAPWARLDEVTDWRMIIAGTAMAVRGGVRRLGEWACEGAYFTRGCPLREEGDGWCGGRHRRLDPTEVQLDDLVAWTAEDKFVPLYVPSKDGLAGRHIWVSPQDKADFLQGNPESVPVGPAALDAAADKLIQQGEQPIDLTCHYGEVSTVRRVRVPRDDGAPIVAVGPEPRVGIVAGGEFVALQPPGDLVELRIAFLAAEADCARARELEPSGSDISGGLAVITDEVRASVKTASDNRMRIVLAIHRHPWWAMVSNRAEAEAEMRKIANERIASGDS